MPCRFVLRGGHELESVLVIIIIMQVCAVGWIKL